MTAISEVLGGLPLADVGAGALVVIIVLLILTGRLVPKSALDYERENSKAWQRSAETKDQINAELKAAVTELLPLARSTDHALRSIQAFGQYQQGEEPR